MEQYTRWRNPKGAVKIEDRDLIVLIILYLLSPFLVLAAWLKGTREVKYMHLPLYFKEAVLLIYGDLYKIWKEYVK